MTQRSDLLAQLAVIQAKLAVLNNAPEDTYPLGTMARFAANSNSTHWHIIKIGEEAWDAIGTTATLPGSDTKDLAEWILKVSESNMGYFELYILTVSVNPIYTSA